jgi:hypothetical protein
LGRNLKNEDKNRIDLKTGHNLGIGVERIGTKKTQFKKKTKKRRN